MFLSSPSSERLRDQGLSKVRHAAAGLLGPGAPQTDTRDLYPAFGTKSDNMQKGKEAEGVGLSLFARPQKHINPASLISP